MTRGALVACTVLAACGSPHGPATTPPENHGSPASPPPPEVTHLEVVLVGFTDACPDKITLFVDGVRSSYLEIPCPPPLSPAPGRMVVSDGPDVTSMPKVDVAPGRHRLRIEYRGASVEHTLDFPSYEQVRPDLAAKGVRGRLQQQLPVNNSDLGLLMSDLVTEMLMM